MVEILKKTFFGVFMAGLGRILKMMYGRYAKSMFGF